MLFLNIKLNDLLDGKSTYCWFIFYTNRSQSPFLIDVNQVNWIPILHPMNKYLSHNVSLPYKYKCYIFSRRSFIHVHNYSYNMCNICICSTEKLKFIPLLCTHINPYVLWKVHPPRMLQGSGKVSKIKTNWCNFMNGSNGYFQGHYFWVIHDSYYAILKTLQGHSIQ